MPFEKIPMPSEEKKEEKIEAEEKVEERTEELEKEEPEEDWREQLEKEFPTPKELDLEDKEGRILRKEEAAERAYAEKTFREIALTPGLSEEAKAKLLEQAEQAEEETGQRWREEHQEELLEEYKARIREIQEKEHIPDSEVAQAMTTAEQPYRIAASLEGISEKDKEILLKQAEEVAEQTFEIVTPGRLEALDKEIKSLKDETEKIKEGYKDRLPERKEVPQPYVYEERGTRLIYPARFIKDKYWSAILKDKKPEEISQKYYEWHEGAFKNLEYIWRGKQVEENRSTINLLEKDWQELLPQFQRLIKEREEKLEPLKETKQDLQNQLKSLREPKILGKEKYKLKKKELEKNLGKTLTEIKTNEANIDHYKFYTVERAEKFLKTAPLLYDLLSRHKETARKEEETIRNRNELQEIYLKRPGQKAKEYSINIEEEKKKEMRRRKIEKETKER